MMVFSAADNRRALPWVGWPEGDYYVPRFSTDGRTAVVPGAADTHRRLFLIRAAMLEPQLLTSLREVGKTKRALARWAKRWQLADSWCQLLARDTVRHWANHPEVQGWEFENHAILSGHFGFNTKPLRLGPYYHDPTWRTRADFRRYVLRQVREALNRYCDRIESAAVDAGLKRAPRKRELRHFDWLVRYHIKGESYASIARHSSPRFGRFGRGRQTVRKAVVELAEYLGLTLRLSTSRASRLS